MVNTPMPSSTAVRFVSARACVAPSSLTPAFSTAVPAISARISLAAMTSWLDGQGARGNGNHEGMYAVKRIHPGRLGGVT